ncbi:CRISPR-associated protein Cas4 [Chloroflexi bacterium CFX3]|nr:CRISPR-associated protein Cas4 [Chloroflexi bacterium CFX3]
MMHLPPIEPDDPTDSDAFEALPTPDSDEPSTETLEGAALDEMIERAELADALTITLLKQYTYCPRVVYYETCTPGVRPTTYKMEAGAALHTQEKYRAARRTLAAYQVPEGTRQFDVRLHSAALGLVGMVDELVFMPDEVIPVDYKMSAWLSDNHIIQIAAYGMLAEETFGLPAKRGYVYLLKGKRYAMVEITTALRSEVLAVITDIDRIHLTEYMPPPPENTNKCIACEFKRFCNDV